MPKYGLIACFSPVIKVNIGKRKFNSTGSAKIGKWKQIGVLAIQKVAKTGKQLQWQANQGLLTGCQVVILGDLRTSDTLVELYLEVLG